MNIGTFGHNLLNPFYINCILLKRQTQVKEDKFKVFKCRERSYGTIYLFPLFEEMSKLAATVVAILLIRHCFFSFFKKWAIPGLLFVYFRSFSNKQ